MYWTHWNVLKWFGHVGRMREERLVKREYWANVEGNRRKGRPQRRWRGEVEDLLSERDGMMLARDSDSWAGMVYRVE